MTLRSSVLGLATLAVVAVGCAETGEPAQVSNTDVVRLEADGVTQTIVPRGENLSRVTVFTATYGVEAPTGVLRLTVDGAGASRTALVDGAEIEDNAPLEVVFPPITGAAGQRFELTFVWQEGDPLGLYVNRHDAYPDGELSPTGGDLAFLAGHAGRLEGTLDAVGRVPLEFTEVAGRDPLFTTLWILSGVAVLALLVVVGRSARPSPGRSDRRSRRRGAGGRTGRGIAP